MAASEPADPSKLKVVEDWNSSIPKAGTPVSASNITRECVKVFRKLSKVIARAPGIAPATCHHFERSCSSLVLWDTGYGVSDGKLDGLLADSTRLRRSILELLVSVSKTITERLVPFLDLTEDEKSQYKEFKSATEVAMTAVYEESSNSSDSSADDSEPSSVSGSEDCLTNIAQDLWTDIQCLIDLDPLIKSPAPDAVLASQLTFPERIIASFPDANPDLVNQLAQANHPACISLQPNPTSNNTWNPTRPNPSNLPTPPTQFHRYGLSLWTPPTDWQSGSNSLVDARAVTPGPGPPVLWSSPGFRSPFNPIATYLDPAFGMASDMAPAETQEPRLEVTSRSTRGSGALLQSNLARFARSVAQDFESCWRCRSDHKKCDPGNPCRRCAMVPSPGNSPIPCCRGKVCDAAAEIPFLCHMPQGAPRLLRESMPLDLQPAANILIHARQRRLQTARHLKGREPVAGSKYGIFSRIINTEVQNIRVFNPFAGLDLINPVELPYDERIADIVWEVEDNPEFVQIMGIRSIEDLVALLEAACLCEAQWGHNDHKRRLVYSSILCLLCSMEALRLSASSLLAVSAHTNCHLANECISPAFHRLTKYALRYAEALTITLFHKDRGKQNNWLLVFYSLYLQGYVRRVLITLEERLQSAQPSAGGMKLEGFAAPLRSANYLQTAVSLFGKISMQNKGRLSKKVRGSRPRPSVYLRQPPHSSSSISSSWQMWCEDGIPEFLGKIFQIPINDSTIHNQPHHTEPPGTGPNSDSDVTITSTAAPAPPARATTQVVGGGVSNADGDCWTPSSPADTLEPSVIASIWSETSYVENSNASTVSYRSLAPSSAFDAKSLGP